MATKYNKSIKLPKDNYILRVVDESFGPSKSSGNPMITLKTEVQSPDEVNVGGEQVTVAGLAIPYYITVANLQDAEKSEACKKRCIVGKENDPGLYQKFGIDPATFNQENPGLGFKGKLFHALLNSKTEAVRKDPTPEQQAKGEQGDIIKNPVTGEDKVYYQVQIEEIYGLAQENPNRPY